MIGGSESYKRNFACLRAFGRMIVFGAASGDTRGTFEPIGLMGKNLTIAGYYLTPLIAQRELCAPPLAEMASLAEQGALKLELGGVYALGEAKAAFEALESRSTVGKIVFRL
jgi:NADPH2:quinone reductase